ncbi:MAG: hypothetical protein ACOC1U_10640, partial [Spirochaetota bacterium]
MVGSGRRSTRALRALVPTLLLFVAAGALSAEVRPTAGVEVYETVFRQADDEWRLASNGLGRVTLAGTGSRNVRGELSIRFPTTTLPIPQIERAYLRFRLPWFRSTLGAAPLSWGEGILLNEADFPNLGYDPAQDFLSGDYRANALWQAQVYVPIGPLAFVEAIALPALPDPMTTLAALAGAEPGAGPGSETGTGGTADPSASAAAFSTELHEISAGARLYVDAGPVALQAGYFWDASRHRFSASVHGALGVDVYLSVAHVLAETSSGFADDLIDGTTLRQRVRALLGHRAPGGHRRRAPVRRHDRNARGLLGLSHGHGRTPVVGPTDGSERARRVQRLVEHRPGADAPCGRHGHLRPARLGLRDRPDGESGVHARRAVRVLTTWSGSSGRPLLAHTR